MSDDTNRFSPPQGQSLATMMKFRDAKAARSLDRDQVEAVSAYPLDTRGRCAACKDRRPSTCRKCGVRYQHWVPVDGDAPLDSLAFAIFAAQEQADSIRARGSQMRTAYHRRTRRR